MATGRLLDAPQGGLTSGIRTVDPARFMATVGVASIVAGGLVAAVTDPLDLSKGSWLAAYLVLVVGLAPWAMAAMQTRPGTRSITPTWWWIQIAAWNLGNLGVIVGTLTGVPGLVDAAAVPLLLALGIALRASWPEPQEASQDDRSSKPAPTGRLVRRGYQLVLLVLVVSVPVGLVLAQLRA